MKCCSSQEALPTAPDSTSSDTDTEKAELSVTVLEKAEERSEFGVNAAKERINFFLIKGTTGAGRSMGGLL